jgi:hypothetical protein
MKGVYRYFLFGLILTAMLAGCSKQPALEINAAKAAVDAAVGEGAEKYAPADTRQVNDALSAAMNEVKTQDGKFLKDYKKAKEMLARVKLEADALKTGLAAKKDEAKKNAVAAGESAWTALNEAKALLKKAPKAKGAAEQIDAVIKAIQGLDDSLQEVQKLIASEDYLTAFEKAGVVKSKTAGVTEQIRNIADKKMAIQKTVTKKTEKTTRKK